MWADFLSATANIYTSNNELSVTWIIISIHFKSYLNNIRDVVPRFATPIRQRCAFAGVSVV
jgi:hypothetical protein